METSMTHQQRLARAQQSLEGLAVGDAFGECFFLLPFVRSGAISEEALHELNSEERIREFIRRREIVAHPPWHWTDDTHMALSIFETLRDLEIISQSTLASRFGQRYLEEPARGYGPAMHTLLPQLASGANWKTAPRELFHGVGSFGNGAAMRVAPVGAYFADDLQAVIQNAGDSAEVTHAHPEGIAGAIAVAVATAVAWQYSNHRISARDFVEPLLPHVPRSAVRHGMETAQKLLDGKPVAVEEAADSLGSGQRVTAQDTVPFVIWCAAQHLDNYEEALWLTVAGLGDRDTTCAMVGGIVAMSAPQSTLPAKWRESREPLPHGY
jgi:ADP-ribosylglycohydrolase